MAESKLPRTGTMGGGHMEITFDKKFNKMTRKIKLRSVANNLANILYGCPFKNIRKRHIRSTDLDNYKITVCLPPADGSVDLEAAQWNDRPGQNMTSDGLIYFIRQMINKALKVGVKIILKE